VFSPGIWWREGRYLLLPRDETISNTYAALNLLVGVAEAAGGAAAELKLLCAETAFAQARVGLKARLEKPPALCQHGETLFSWGKQMAR